MGRALIVSAGASSNEYISARLAELGYTRPTIIPSGAEARRRMLESDFELIVVNAPLPDEFGHELCSSAVEKTDAGVVLLAKAAAAEQLLAEGYTPPTDVYLASSCTEEWAGDGAPKLVAELQRRGVELFLEKLRASGRDIRALHRARIAAIGPGTQAELRKYGLLAELVPQVFDGQHLGEALASRLRPGDRVWLPRAKQGGRELLEELERVPGAVVRELPLYDTVYQPAGALELSAEFQKHPETLAVFTSASTVRGFAAMAEGLDLTSVRAACIGPQTGAAARALGMEVHTAERATIDSLIQLVKQMHKGV